MQKYKKTDVSISSFAYLFSELISYLWRFDQKTAQQKLKNIGADIAFRLYHLMGWKQKTYQRQIRILPMIKFIQSNVFKYIFGKQADKVFIYKHPKFEDKNLYVIRDSSPMILKYIPQTNQLTCSTFVAGVIEQVLRCSGMQCKVQAQTVVQGEQNEINKYPETQYIITFDQQTERKYKVD